MFFCSMGSMTRCSSQQGNKHMLLLCQFVILRLTCIIAYVHGQPETIVRKIVDLTESSYGIPGLSHITVSGALPNGNKEVDVWMETFAPKVGTPIHRHNCEEVFVVVKGTGTLFLAPTTENKFPGEPTELPFSSNSTFTIYKNVVHQVVNTNAYEDVHVLVILSRPPVQVYVYKDWNTPHSHAKFASPLGWDQVEAHSKKDEL